jgi:sulfonate transport system ATP-binding protein
MLVQNDTTSAIAAGTPTVKVKVNKLTKCFGDLTVLSDISFHVNKGEFLCIVGPTGCGKTTFLNLLTKLVEPTSGEILIDGEPADPNKHNLAFVFQEPSTFPWLSVRENIEFGLRIKHYPDSAIKEQTNKILELLGLVKSCDAFPHELSVSAEQRIVIGRAFAMNPDLLLMDEPYGQMDIKLRYYLEDEVVRLWQELGSTVIFVTHNIEEAVYLAERVLILSPKPASVKEEVLVDLPRPRNFSDPEFIRIRKHVNDMIRWW